MHLLAVKLGCASDLLQRESARFCVDELAEFVLELLAGLIELPAALNRTEGVTALHVEPDSTARTVEKRHRAGLRRLKWCWERAGDSLQAGTRPPAQRASH